MKGWICLLALLAAGQSVPDKSPTATLDGRVINSATGEPVRYVSVTLAPAAQREEAGLVAETDEAGHFRFANIAPGVYGLTAEKHGFLDGGYGKTKPADELTLLRLNAGDRLPDLTLRLFPAGTISGRVLNPDGEPYPGPQVLLWTKTGLGAEATLDNEGQSTTTPNGEYFF